MIAHKKIVGIKPHRVRDQRQHAKPLAIPFICKLYIYYFKGSTKLKAKNRTLTHHLCSFGCCCYGFQVLLLLQWKQAIILTTTAAASLFEASIMVDMYCYGM